MSENNLLSQCKQMRDRERISIFLPWESELDITCYKVLQQTPSECLLPVYKSFYNGQMKLTYPTNDYFALGNELPSLSLGKLLQVMERLLRGAEEIAAIGFLHYAMISLTLDDIYISRACDEIRLLYFPVLPKDSGMGQLEFDEEIKGLIEEMLSACVHFGPEELNKIKTVKQQLSGPLKGLQELLRGMMDGGENDPSLTKGGGTQEEFQEMFAPAPVLPRPEKRGFWRRPYDIRLVGVDTPEPVSIEIGENGFTVGKSLNLAKAALLFNEKISRVHCQFDRSDTTWYITDLSSRNGTYLNGRRLEPKRAYALKLGDQVKLSSQSTFVIEKK